MTTLDWDLATNGEVTLVHVAVRTDVPRAVRIENQLAGPVWPPRSQGRPLAGWDEDGYRGTVDPETPLVLGYATPADPAEPPVSLAPADPPDGEPTPTGLVRALGEAGPPRAAVPEMAPAGTARVDRDADVSPAPFGSDPETGSLDSGSSARPTAPPSGLEAWLTAVDRRVHRLTGETDDEPPAPASGARRPASGDLAAQVAEDRAAVAAVRERTAALADRLERLSLPDPEREG